MFFKSLKADINRAVLTTEQLLLLYQPHDPRGGLCLKKNTVVLFLIKKKKKSIVNAINAKYVLYND